MRPEPWPYVTIRRKARFGGPGWHASRLLGDSGNVDSWLVSVLILIAVPILASGMIRIVAAIPARPIRRGAAPSQPRPQLPGWFRRSWLVASMLLAMVSFSYL